MQEFKIDKHTTAVAEFEKTRNGFRHVAILMKDGHEVDRAKVTYLNRTWESFEFETVLQRLLLNHPEISEKTKKAFFARASGHEVERVESQFKTTTMVAKMGDVLAKTPKEKIDWKERMLKAGMPDLQLPEDWNELSDKEKEARLDRVIELMGKTGHNKKKHLEDVS